MQESTITSDILNLDPLLAAEKVTGKSYKDDRQTALLGMFINQMKSKVVKGIRESERDTYYRIGWDEFKKLIVSRGFTIDFQQRFEYEEGRPRPEEIIAHRGFVLLHATSFTWTDSGEETLNGGSVYWQTVCNLSNIMGGQFRVSGGCVGHLDIPGDYDYKKISDKSLDKDRFIHGGSFDVRDGLFSCLDGIEAISTPIPIEKDQFIWCVNYAEDKVKGYDSQQITRSKIQTVPTLKTVIPLMWRD